MKKIVFALSLVLVSTVAAKETPVYLDDSKPIEERVEDALSRMTLDEKIAICHAQSKFSTPGCQRLGIPEIWMSDGPHGVRMEFDWDDWTHAGWTNDSCTALPALTCLAASFNPELAFEYGNVIGEEARFRKKDIILGPGVNIYRTPLSGRNFEYMGEDPYLSSTLVVPYVKGLQQNGVAACAKHFALNNQEKWRDHINVVVSDRALNEIYLPAFKAAVTKGGIWAIMGSYNKYKNQYCSHNDTLINKILKGDWKFDGVVVTDWGSAHDTYEAAMYGLDIEMGSWTNGLTWGLSSAYNNYYMAEPLKKKIVAGEIPVSVLDEKVRRILRLCFRTNMNRFRPFGSFQTEEHAQVAQKVAEEGIVLLKNDKNILPIVKGKYKKIAVIGENAVKQLTEGGGSSELKPKVVISPLQGMKDCYGDAVEFSLGYASGAPNYSNELPSGLDADSLRRAAVDLAARSEIVVYFGGLNKNFTQDCEGDDRRFYHLPFGQDQLLEEMLKVNKNIVVVIISGNAVDMPWEKKVPAIVQSWYLGSYAGTATANVLSGKVNPSGKMPFSCPMKLEDNSAHYFGERSYPGVDSTVYYMDDILVGYRWHDTKKIKPRYAFGYGLSYTTFKYGEISVDKDVCSSTDTVRVSLEVENTGNVDGAECVQFYVGQKSPSVVRPVKELKGFKKVFLKAHEKQVVTIDLPVETFAFYDEPTQKWKVEADTYTISAAAASDDVRRKVNIKVVE